METNHHNKLFITGIVSVLVVIFVLLAAVAFKYQKNTQKSGVSEENKVQATGSMWATVDVGKPIGQGDRVTVQIFADSYGNPISGYDVDLDLSRNLKFVSAQSNLEDFNIVPTVRPGGVIITGYKKLGSEKAEIFGNRQMLMAITLEAAAAGQASVQPVVDRGKKTKSNLIDRQNNNILNIVKGTTFQIK